MKYEIVATYHVKKTMIVEVPEGKDPLNSANWGDIEDENDNDCWLYDVHSAVESEDV